MRQVRGHSSAVTLLVYSHYRKLVIIVYKVINMDGCTFLGFKISCTIHSHYKAGKSQGIFNISLIVFGKKKVIQLGWLEGR